MSLQKFIEFSWFSIIIKWIILGWTSFIFFVIVLFQPLYITKIYIARQIVPINDKFYVRSISYRPLLSLYVCEAIDANLHRKLLLKQGYTLTLKPEPEPFGYDNNNKKSIFVILHNIPEEASPGDIVEVYKIIKYKCLGITRTVESPSTSFTVGESDPDVSKTRYPGQNLNRPELLYVPSE